MSAHIVGHEVISNILGCYAACRRKEPWLPGDLSDRKIREMGQKLLDANCISVNYRYNDTNDEIFELDSEEFHQPCSIAQAIKYCHCLNYQSCEYPQWERSEAKTLLDEMRETFVRHMPGYDEAQWC
ncbi:conserved hypothetical protein [Candidatus Glomeribacter gigasporarum BEG34]|uniref:Uncharacterized protein n=1 Tax=Candidatus Glomeribacter gigasporarum BEG34 TaxID=1070319 RepID=G2JBC7_9BURK|nr:hypothetical protein [Candidatus Glomeribacter gigasporarum]CCD30081.1 conserved hypothetical protein [Candidatus Glomeribacter gigasporarum BEG34]